MAKGRENLTPFSERSREERSENGRKGGVASGKARRRKKALRLALKEAVNLQLKDLPDDMRGAIMAAVGISDDSRTVADAVIGGMILSACAGSAPMMKVLLDTRGHSHKGAGTKAKRTGGERRTWCAVLNRFHMERERRRMT